MDDIIKDQKPCNTPEELEATRQISANMKKVEADLNTKAAMSKMAVKDFVFTT